ARSVPTAARNFNCRNKNGLFSRDRIQMSATARGHLVSGGRVERNWGPGIRVDGTMNAIEGTWFEGNGRFFDTKHGICVTSQAQKTRILANLFSSQLIGDDG